MFSFKNQKVIITSKGGVQTTIINEKRIQRRGYAQVVELFYISVIPFSVLRNPAFANMCEMISKYVVGYKPLSYHILILERSF